MSNSPTVTIPYQLWLLSYVSLTNAVIMLFNLCIFAIIFYFIFNYFFFNFIKL